MLDGSFPRLGQKFSSAGGKRHSIHFYPKMGLVTPWLVPAKLIKAVSGTAVGRCLEHLGPAMLSTLGRQE